MSSRPQYYDKCELTHVDNNLLTQKKWQLHITHSYTGYTAKKLAFYKYFVYFELIYILC